jgi:hypothetical protein
VLLGGIVYWDDKTAAQYLCAFERFDRWTAPLLAAFWGLTPETARGRLRPLVEAGVVVCVAGAVRGRGGREPDLYVLAAHGALVLDHLYGRSRHTTKAPQLATGTPTTTARGRRKLPPVAGGTTPHVLNCLRLALHQGWVGDARWRIMRRLDDRPGGAGDDPLPDFALVEPGRLFAVEVEGTLHHAHINEKHRRYAALAGSLRAQFGPTFAVFLSVVLTFADDRDHANALRAHELAFARRGRDYTCAVARLPAVLATPSGTTLWAVVEELDRRAIRERARARHDRLRRLYDDW